MYASVAIATTFPFQQVYNLSLLPEGTHLPSMKYLFKRQSYKGKFLNSGRPKNMPRHLPGFVPSRSAEIAPLMPISSSACLPPERAKLSVNSKKETNGRVEMDHESTVNSKKETNGRVKMGQESRWAAVVDIGC